MSIPRRHDLIFTEASFMKGLIPSQGGGHREASATRPCKCILSMVLLKKQVWCQEHVITCKKPSGCRNSPSFEKKKLVWTTYCMIHWKRGAQGVEEKSEEGLNSHLSVSTSHVISQLYTAELKPQVWHNPSKRFPAAPPLPFTLWCLR